MKQTIIYGNIITMGEKTKDACCHPDEWHGYGAHFMH